MPVGVVAVHLTGLSLPEALVVGVVVQATTPETLILEVVAALLLLQLAEQAVPVS